MIALPADTYTEATSIINLRNAAFAPDPAIKAITKSGGLPIVLPTVAAENAASYVDLFDGLLLLGGFDVDPTFYGQEPHFELGKPSVNGTSLKSPCLRRPLRPANRSWESAGGCN